MRISVGGIGGHSTNGVLYNLQYCGKSLVEILKSNLTERS